MDRVKLGDKFNNWKVTGPSSFKSNSKYYECTCVCGKVKDVRQHNLLNNLSKGCGCDFHPVVYEKTRQLQSQLAKTRPAPRPKGFTHSEETKSKISATKRAKQEAKGAQK